MATKRSLIETAAAEFGINSAFDLSPEEMQEGLTRLNRIAAQWDGQGIRVGYNLGAGLDEDAGIPDTAENAFSLELAVRWSGSFGKVVSQDTRSAARAAWNALYASRGVRPQTARNPALPTGAGNRQGVLRGRTYFPEPGNDVEGLNDGATEY
jgi:hypothetical protein